jgi:hypothetical protein
VGKWEFYYTIKRGKPKNPKKKETYVSYLSISLQELQNSITPEPYNPITLAIFCNIYLYMFYIVL